MKVRVTAKDIKRRGTPICFDYGDLQNILADHDPQFYTCGVYGWNANIYDFGSFQIVTGYRPFGMDAHAIPYRKMDKAARENPGKRQEICNDFLELCKQLSYNEELDPNILAKYAD